MKKISFILVITFITVICLFFQTEAKLQANYKQEVKTYSLGIEDIDKIKKKADFKILTLQGNYNWRVEIIPISNGNLKKVQMIRLSYFEKNSDKMIVGFEQMQATGITQPFTNGVKNIDINGNKAYFESWKNSIRRKAPKGGILQWIQNGTYIQMQSSVLTENEMIKLAQSMK